MISSFRNTAFALLAAAISANAQLSVPPATYQPAVSSKAQITPALLLPSGAAARSIVLSMPTSAERDGLAPKVATNTSKSGVVPKRRRMIIGFPRQVAPAQGSFNLSDLAWAKIDGGMQVAHISLTSSSAAAVRISIVLTGVPAALVMRSSRKNLPTAK